MYGPHLILEAYDADKKLLSNMQHIYSFLDKLPPSIDMHPICPPHVQQYSSKPDPRWGISGFILIAESHIVLHTYPEDQFMVMDLFSCKHFDENTTLVHILKAFKITEYEHHLFRRGTHYSTNVSETSNLIIREREVIADKTLAAAAY